jgi:hypothetical protein
MPLNSLQIFNLIAKTEFSDHCVHGGVGGLRQDTANYDEVDVLEP